MHYIRGTLAGYKFNQSTGEQFESIIGISTSNLDGYGNEAVNTVDVVIPKKMRTAEFTARIQKLKGQHVEVSVRPSASISNFSGRAELSFFMAGVPFLISGSVNDSEKKPALNPEQPEKAAKQ